jgi:CubicO group peptidase (beta-lactamase class C family)
MRPFDRRHRAAAWPALLVLSVVLPAVALAAAEPPPAGRWQGAIELPGQSLAVEVDLSRAGDSWSGHISIPAQGAHDLPLADVRVEGTSVHMAITGVPGNPTFAGTLAKDGGTITGTFTQGGQSFPFSLASASSTAAAARDALAGFDEEVAAAMKTFAVPGLALAVVRDGRVVMARGFGVRGVDAKEPVTADTLFAIGSSTKAFTTFVMGELVDEGKLAWEEPVRTYIPWFRLEDPWASEHITPLDLVTHRSGLPRHDLVWYNNLGASREELVRRLAFLAPSADLRAKFQYNNLMFLTAGYLVETITGKSWEDAVRTRIFVPLGMTHSNFSVRESQRSDDFAQPYEEKNDVVRRMPFRVVTTIGPAGSINSTANDMARWLLVHLDGGEIDGRRIIKAATLDNIHSAHMTTGATSNEPEVTPADYGLGWFVNTYRGHIRVEHGGNIDGFSALVTLFPQDSLGVVVLTNLNGTPLPELIARRAVDRELGLERIDWIGKAAARRTAAQEATKEAKAKKDTMRVPGTKPSHPLADYAGTYENPGYGALTIALAGDHLDATFNGITTPLEHWHYDVFNGGKAADDTFEDMRFNFRTDASGDIADVTAPFEPAVADIVFAREPDAWMSDPAQLERFTGNYELAGQLVTVDLQGDALTLLVPGQPVYDLEPAVGGVFVLKQARVVRVRFITDRSGRVSAVELRQPNGVFTAKRKE